MTYDLSYNPNRLPGFRKKKKGEIKDEKVLFGSLCACRFFCR